MSGKMLSFSKALVDLLLVSSIHLLALASPSYFDKFGSGQAHMSGCHSATKRAVLIALRRLLPGWLSGPVCQ
jgi:hypothetical protein